MLNHDLIILKLSYIKKYLGELVPILEKVNATTDPDTVSVHAIERLFQLVVDAAIDINTHIITRSNLETPTDYQGTFSILERANVIPSDLSSRIANSVGLRNQLIHGYERKSIYKKCGVKEVFRC